MLVFDDLRPEMYVPAYTPTLSAFRDAALRFPQNWADYASCAPGRCSMQTGHRFGNHRVDLLDKKDYYRFDVIGMSTSVGSVTRYFGPHQQQVTSSRGVGDVPLRYSGNIFNQARPAGIVTLFHGKFQNHHGAPEDMTGIPGGVDYRTLGDLGGLSLPLSVRRMIADLDIASLLVGDHTAVVGAVTGWGDSPNNEWRLWWAEKDRENTTNHGADGTADRVVYRSYDKPLTAGSFLTNAATVTCPGATNEDGHGLEPGDLIDLRGCTPSGYNTNGYVPVLAVDGNQITYPLAVNPGGALTSGTLYARKHYGLNRLIDSVTAAYERVGDTESFLSFICPGSPHFTIPSTVAVEKVFEGTVPATEFFYADGTPGSYPTTIDSFAFRFAGARSQWASDMEQLRSADAAFKQLVEYLADRGWLDETLIIVTADQGRMHGEHGIYVNSGGIFFVKNNAYPPSAKADMWWWHSRLPAGEFTDRWTTHADLYPTLLALLGLHDNVALTDPALSRDGVNILDVLTGGADAYPDRALYMEHRVPSTANVNALLDQHGYLYIPENFASARTITAASWASGTVTMTTSTSHGLVVGDRFVVAGVTPSGYNSPSGRTFVCAANLSSTQFQYALAGDPGAYSSGGTMKEGFPTQLFHTPTSELCADDENLLPGEEARAAAMAARMPNVRPPDVMGIAINTG